MQEFIRINNFYIDRNQIDGMVTDSSSSQWKIDVYMVGGHEFNLSFDTQEEYNEALAKLGISD